MKGEIHEKHEAARMKEQWEIPSSPLIEALRSLPLLSCSFVPFVDKYARLQDWPD